MGFEENASSFEILTTISRCFECLGDFGGAVQVMTNLSMDFPGHPRLGDAMLFAGQSRAFPELSLGLGSPPRPSKRLHLLPQPSRCVPSSGALH